MQEGDVQIKVIPSVCAGRDAGVFGNPEDYTARGKINRLLKDRIGAEISTHYPKE